MRASLLMPWRVAMTTYVLGDERPSIDHEPTRSPSELLVVVMVLVPSVMVIDAPPTALPPGPMIRPDIAASPGAISTSSGSAAAALLESMTKRCVW